MLSIIGWGIVAVVAIYGATSLFAKKSMLNIL